MTVEAYLRSLVPGLDLPTEVYQRAARSPKEVGLEPVDLEDDIDAYDNVGGDGEAETDGEPEHGGVDADGEADSEPAEADGDADSEPADADAETDAATLFQMRLDYASSTVYYAVLGVFAGGGFTENHGDVQVRKGGYTITKADRERFKMLADALRRKWGFPTEDTDGGMYDGGYLRRGTRGCGFRYRPRVGVNGY